MCVLEARDHCQFQNLEGMVPQARLACETRYWLPTERAVQVCSMLETELHALCKTFTRVGTAVWTFAGII